MITTKLSKDGMKHEALYDSTKKEYYPKRFSKDVAKFMNNRGIYFREQEFSNSDKLNNAYDAYMEALLSAYQDERLRQPNQVRNLAIEKYRVGWNRQQGLTTKGDIPKKGKFLHTKNVYDQVTGENMIEQMGVDSTGQVIYPGSERG